MTLPRRRWTNLPPPIEGALWMAGAAFFWMCNTILIRPIAADLPPIQLQFLRCLFSALMFTPFILRMGIGTLRTRRIGLYVLRAGAMAISMICWIYAVVRMPMGEAVSLSFTAPLFATMMAALILKEKVRIRRWSAVIIGFIGALVIIRPGFGHTSPYALLVFGSAACYSLYQIFTRYVAGVDRPETSVTYSALVGTVLLSAVVPFYWRAPATLSHALVLISLGLLGGLGHYCVARALLWGPASILSPFHYTQLILAALAGYIVFGDVPSVWTWAGAAIIIGSGLHMVWRETSR